MTRLVIITDKQAGEVEVASLRPCLKCFQFLLHDRLIKARELLSEPNANVTQPAYAVGFSSLSMSAKSFTLFTSEAPGKYIRQIRP